MADHRHWILLADGPVAHVRLNRPEEMNSLTTRTLVELREILGDLSGQVGVVVVVIEGEGDHFSSGFDLAGMAGLLSGSIEAAQTEVRLQQECLQALAAFEKPTIARLHGFCIGGGILLALCCDFRIASQRTIFHLPEIQLGMPILWGTYRVTRLLGEAAAKEIILLHKRFKPDYALAHGLIHQAVKAQDLDQAVAALADKLCRIPGRSLRLAKQIIHGSLDLTPVDSQRVEVAALEDLAADPDVRRAIESYLGRHLRPWEAGGSVDT
jgi:enoyl-CoA hydratase/carnithine racemase